jgi:hypothetical protein
MVLMLAIVLLAGERTTSFDGKIQDNSGIGIMLSSLEVYTTGINSKLVYTATTGLNGKFTLNGLKREKYKIKISAPGFEDRIAFVDLSKNTGQPAVFQLNGNVITLDTVMIYGKGS